MNLDSIGTWNQPAGPLLDIPGVYGQPALDLLAYAGVDPATFPEFVSSSIPSTYGLRAALLFPAAEFGTDTATPNRQNATEPNTPEGWTAFLARTPYAAAAREAIVQIQTAETDWIAAKHGPMSVADKIQLLTQLTYRRYLEEYIGAPAQAILQYQRTSHSLLGAGVQAVSAADMWLLGQPGFDGLGLGDPTNITFPGIGRTPQMGVRDPIDPTLFWPDGNTSLLKLVLAKLIPGAVTDGGAAPDQETIVRATARLRAAGQAGQRRAHPPQQPRRAGRARPRTQGPTRPSTTCLPTAAGAGAARPGTACAPATSSWRAGTGSPRRSSTTSRATRSRGSATPARSRSSTGGRCCKNWNAWAAAKVSSISPRGNSLFWDSASIAAGSSFGSVYGPTPVDPSLPAVLNVSVVPPTRTARRSSRPTRPAASGCCA